MEDQDAGSSCRGKVRCIVLGQERGRACHARSRIIWPCACFPFITALPCRHAHNKLRCLKTKDYGTPPSAHKLEFFFWREGQVMSVPCRGDHGHGGPGTTPGAMVGRRGQEGGPAEERVASAVALAGAAFSRALVPSALTPARPSHTALFQHAAPCHCRRPPPVHAMLHATPSCITRIAQGLAVVLAASCSVRAERVDGCEGDCVNGAGTYTFPDGTVYTVRACVRLCVWCVET